MSATYVNPFGKGLTKGRTDMGVDYSGKGTISAIGDAVIERVLPQGTRTGWPGAGSSKTGAMIVYRLTSGARKGQHVYLAENVDPVSGLKAGQVVKAGQPIATARGAYPFLESGWSDALGQPLNHATYTEGAQTAGGKDFTSFIDSLAGGPGTATASIDTGGGVGLGGALEVAGGLVLGPAGAVAGGVDAVTGIVGDVAGAVGGAVGGLAGDVAKGIVSLLWDAIGQDALRALLYVVLVGGGLGLGYAGTKRVLEDQEPG